MSNQLKIDTYYDITCNVCGKSWSTDFNAREGTMYAGGMGMSMDKQWLRKVAKKTGWRVKNGLTVCPVCLRENENF